MSFKRICATVLCVAMVLCETMPHFASEGGEIISSSVPSLNEGQSYHDVNTGEPSVQSILDAEKDNEDGQASLGENDNKGDEDSKGAAEEPENNTDDKQNVDPTDPTNTTDPTEPTDPTDATDATDATEGTDTTTSPTDTTEGTDTTTATSPSEETTTEAVVESTTITKKEKEATISDAEETNNNESENPVISDIASISELISNDSVKLELNTATESTLFGNIEDKEEESKPIKYQEIYDGGFISPGFKVDAVERNTMRLFGADPDPLPTSYDMRTKRNDYNVKILPPVRDQSPYGTCWAHSTIGMIETSLRMKNIVQSESDPGADLSEAAVAYFTYEGLEEVTDPNKATYNIDSPGLEGGDYTCLNYDYYERKGTPRASMSFADCGGNQAAATLVASAYVGAVSEADFPHTEENISDIHTNGIGNRSKYAFNSNRYEILDVDYIDRNDRNTIKRAIMKNGSVGLNYMEHRNEDNCHEIDGEWYYLSPTHVYRISDEYEQALGSNHAVMIVGWNDNIDNSYFTYSGEIYQDCGTYIVASDSVIVNGQAGAYHLTYPKVVDTSGRKGAWLLRNSWGDDSPYMNGGYFWLSYYDVCIDDLMYSIDAVEADTYKYNYHYDTTANTTSFSFNPYNVVANTYKVSDDCNQVLEAINVAFESANVGYQVVIYTKDSEMTSPMDGEEALVQRVHHDTAGIHTVKLNKSILLKSGTYYSISIVPDSYDYYIFCDDSNRSNNSTRHYYNQVDDKQSWYYSSGSGGWVDFGTAYNVSWSGFEKNGKKYGRTFRIRGLTNEAKIITFDANGGEGEMPDQGIKVSSASYINKNTFTRAGYKFIGWNTKEDGTGKSYTDEESVKNLTETDNGTVTLYAQWNEKIYYIVYNGNGSTSGNMTNTNARFDTTIYLKENTYVRTGYHFTEWNTKADGSGTSYDDEAGVLNIAANPGDIVVLYAQWEKNKYKISYDSNGGDGEMNDTIVNYGEETTLTNNAYTKTGYRFSSWNTKADGSGTTYTNGQSIKNLTNKDDETITLYAQWLVNSYTIKYNSNGGNGSMSNTMATYDKNVTLRDNKFTKSGFYFAGWNTAADGSGNSYSNGETVKNLSAENNGYVTLYAQWSSNGYTIIYNSNGGEGTMPKTIAEYGETITLSDNEFTRVGYKFKNWNTKADGTGTSYSNLQSVTNLVSTNNGSITLYAIWEANSYMISFHANGGEGNMSNLTASYGKSVTLPKNTYTRENYVFASWNTNADGTGTSYTNGQTVLNLTDEDDETVVLYAQWREKTEADDTYEITYAVDNDNMVLDDIPLRTTLSDYKNHFELGDSYTMEIDLGNKNYIYTGSKVKIYKNGTLEAEYTNVVRGDVNGDTKISALDYVKVKNHIMGSERITNTAYSLAADYNHDNKISALDYVGIKNYIMNGAG